MTPPVDDEELLRRVEVYWKHRRQRKKAADELGMSKSGLDGSLAEAARRGLLLKDPPAMPGFEVVRVVDGPRGQSVTQAPQRGGPFDVPEGHTVKGVSALVGPDGRVSQQWIKTAQDAAQREAAFRAVIDGLKDEIPRAAPVGPPASTNADLLSQYTITDNHLGMLAWHEEAGEDYDLGIAENLLRRFIDAGVSMSPASGVALLAQLGDYLHFDGHKPLTPEHGNLLDADSRFQKIVRAALRVLRWSISRLLEKHAHVHVIMADANHDPASGVWLREMFAMHFEDEPRVSVDTSASTYYAYEHGEVALFYHHGHKRKPKDVDRTFVSDFREIYGRCKHVYAHMGHRHSDELLSTDLMKVEQHETLAARDAYAAQGGWRPNRSAKVIHYHKRFGEVSRSILTPEMLAA